MRLALQEAKKSFDLGEVPIGAVLVDQFGSVISKGHNLVERKATQLAHAETLAISKANKKLTTWRLNGHWLYVTLEPCLMCLGLVQLSRIDGICFGTASPLFGTGLEKINLDFSFYEKRVKVIPGVLQQECAELLKLFFKSTRAKKKGRQ
ncbi:nucleoside deaminase [Candidatus Dependentiae bacterium]|nr:nucleoside deaminase [Candidatus Dependentiae bacterium]